MERKFNIGTSGWSYKHWITEFYPADLKAKEYLSFYAKFFNITEINTSFYHLPRVSTVEEWANKVPADFKFCPKISRYITHMKKLKDVEESVEKFFNVFDHIADRVGPVLVQLPKSVTFLPEKTEIFYQLLRNRYSEYEFVMEVRHESWFGEESLDMMRKYDIGLVISQSGGFFPYNESVTAKNVYIRFHGPAELYASRYSDEMLMEYAQKCAKWIEHGHIVWAFFNNDIHGYANQDAQRFRTLLEKIVEPQMA